MPKQPQSYSNPVTLATDEWAAHDAAVTTSTPPVMTSGYAVTPDDAAVGNQVSANGDAVRIACDRDGAVYSHPYPPRIWSTYNRFTAAQTGASLKAGTAGLSLFLKTISWASEAAIRIALINSTTTTVWAKTVAASSGCDNIDPPIRITAGNGIAITTAGTSVTCDIMTSGFFAA